MAVVVAPRVYGRVADEGTNGHDDVRVHISACIGLRLGLQVIFGLR